MIRTNFEKVKNLNYKISVKTIKSAIIGISLCLSGAAKAGLIYNTGDNFATDTTSELDWILTSETQGKSVDEVRSLIASSGALDGWRFATVNDLIGLYNNLGGDGIYNSYFPSPSLEEGLISRHIMDTLGISCLRCGNEEPHLYMSVYDYGLYGDGDFVWDLQAHTDGNGGDPYSGELRLYRDITRSESAEYFMVGLVRKTKPVPEPSTLVIFALGFMGLALRRLNND